MQKNESAPRAAVDTNLVIGGMISPQGIGKKLLTAFREHAFHWILTDEAFAEIADVLRRADIQGKYHLEEAAVGDFLVTLADSAEFVQPLALSALPIRSRDRDDDFLLALAFGGEADYLVTQDNDLLVLAGRPELGTLTIETAVEFLRRGF